MPLIESSVTMGPDEGKVLHVLANRYTFKVTSQDTNGAYALWQTETDPGAPGAPLHVHYGETESFYVLEGEREVQLGDEVVTARAGSFVHIPAGVVHTYRNSGSTPVRFLGLVVPGGFEQFFLEVGQPEGEATSGDRDAPPDVAGIVETAAKYQCEILVPPEG